jgi:TonB-linked SusC/RagA family outer membrane protein
MKRLCVFLACFVFVGINLLQAQTVQITGAVSSAEEGPLPGVSIIVKGTTVGTTTDGAGKYSINVPANATVLTFSFMGYKTQDVAIAGRRVIDVVLESDAMALEEIVVVGYGIQYKRDVSGSVSTVKGESLKTIPVQSFDQALQGKAAGVSITMPNGVLGNPPVIRVRGFNSISSSSSPLIVVDGVPVFTGDLSRSSATLNVLGDINPADIASIDVLKDASATAIYGSRAANGVILITTKKGVEGKTTVTYDASLGYTEPYRIYDVFNAQQFVQVKNAARANAGLADAYFLNVDANGKTIDTKWSDYVYQTGMQQNHALTVSGGTKATKFFLSLGYNNSDGMIKTNMYERKNVRLNVDHTVTNYLTIGANITYSNSYTTAPNTGSVAGANFSTAGAGRLAFVTAPNVPVFLANGDYNIDYPNNRVGLLNNTQAVGFFHPVFLFDKNYNTAQNDRIISSIFANLKIIEGLYARSTFGYDNSIVESKIFWHPAHGDGRTRGGEAYAYMDRRNRWNWTNTLNYDLTLMDKINIRALAGSEQQYTTFNGWMGLKTGLSDTFFDTYQGAFTTPQQPLTPLLSENYFTSFFGRLNLNYDKKYYFEVSARRDGFSGLAPGNKFGNFGGASLMWNVSNEDFIKSSSLNDVISDLRLKASYGRVGNISGVSDYASLFLYSSAVYNGNPTLFFSQAGNADLGWEASNKIDFGLAFGLLRDKLQVEVGFYKNDIEGLILNVPQSPSKGIPDNRLPMNIGSMYNQGLELTLTSYNVRTNDFSWTTTLNLSTLKNEVTSLAPGVPFIAGVTQLETTNRTLVGYPIGNIWGVQTLGVDPATGRRMFQRKNTDGTFSTVYYSHAPGALNGWRNEDGTASRAIDIANDGKVLGNAIPKIFGGLDNSISYKNFDFNLGLTYAFGFYVYNGSKAGMRDQRNWNNAVDVYENYWRNPGDITDIPRPVWGDNVSNGSSMVQSQNVEKADFVKVRNVSLGYTFKNELFNKAGISSLRLYGQLFNAYVFTGYSGADPEISSMGDSNLAPGVDRNTVPQARTYSFGINLTF